MKRFFSLSFSLMLIFSISMAIFATPPSSTEEKSSQVSDAPADNTASATAETVVKEDKVTEPAASDTAEAVVTDASSSDILNENVITPATTSGNSALRTLTPPIWMEPDTLIDNENLPKPKGDAMLSESEMGSIEINGSSTKFTNFVDGYSVVIPSDMEVDQSLSDICTIFTSSHKQLKIFKETFTTSAERLSYLKYSNKFAENTADHKIEKDESITRLNREYHILQWTRKTLKHIKNDKNYYACIDVCEGARVYTFFFTSDTPFSSSEEYLNIVDSLITFDPSVAVENAYNRGYKKSDINHMTPAIQSTYNSLFGENAEFKMGMFAPEKYGGFEKLSEFEKALGYNINTFLVYTEFTDPVGVQSSVYISRLNNMRSTLRGYLNYARSTGKVIELTLQTPLTRTTDENMVYDILNGEFDTFLSAYIEEISFFRDVPILFRPFNEMNGDWCKYSAFHTSRDPQIYVELYKYLYKKFENAGCKNLIWVWNPNEKSFPNYKWNNQSLYYPGDEYVDVYGITGYNTGTYYSGETWRSFDEIYSPIYERALRINEKPMMITEFACSSIGGDKVAWLEDMFTSLPKYDKIKLAIWWHAADYDGETIARPYFMDTPDGMLEVFDKYLN